MMIYRNLIQKFIFIVFILLLFSFSSQAAYVYYTDYNNSKVHRIKTDGTGYELVSSGTVQPVNVAVNPYEGKVYWSSWSYGDIYKSDLDGSNRVSIFNNTVDNSLRGIAVDSVNNKVYFKHADKIKRMNLDGSNVEDFLTTSVTQIEVDPTGGHLYWGDNSRIRRANLDGTNVVDLITGLSSVRNISLDTANSQIFWNQTSFSGTVRKANLDGTGVTTINAGPLGYNDGIAVGDNGKVYYTEYSTGSVYSANLDGTGVQTLANLAPNSNIIGLAYLADVDNTLVGTNVLVNLRDSNLIRLENVTGQGYTEDSDYTGFDRLTQDFSYLGDYIPNTFKDVTSSATNSGDFLIALTYSDADFTTEISSNPSYAGLLESDLRGFHLEGNVWVDRTATAADLAFFGISDVPVNTATNTIYIRSSSLSPFGVGVNPEPTTIFLLGSALLGLIPFRRKK